MVHKARGPIIQSDKSGAEEQRPATGKADKGRLVFGTSIGRVCASGCSSVGAVLVSGWWV